MTDDGSADDADNSATDSATDATLIRARALKLLARREHATAQLLTKLVAKGFDRDASRIVVDELADEDLQSETRYAEAMVADRARRGIGPNRIRADMAYVGCERGAVEHALADAEVDWRELAIAARVKRFGETLPSDRRERARQVRFLQGRGFDGETIQNALDG